MTVATVPLRRVVVDACDGPFGSSLKSEHYSDSGARVIRLGNIGNGFWIDGDAAFLPLDYWATLSRHHAAEGDVLIAGLGDEGHAVGRACVLPAVGPAMVKADCYRLRIDTRKAEPRFIARFLSSAEGEAEALRRADGATRARLTLGKTLSIPVPDLPLAQQRAIADYLDTETARIDALVQHRRQMASLVMERWERELERVIGGDWASHVILEDSVTSAPDGWKIQRLVRLLDPAVPLVYGILLVGPHVDDGVPFVGAGDVRPHRLRLDRLPRTSPEIAAEYPRSKMRAGELVYAIRGSFGAVEQLPSELDGANLSRDAARIAPGNETHPRWLLWALRSHVAQEQFQRKEVGTAVTGVNIGDLRRVRLPVPPPDQQVEIAHYLDARWTAVQTALRSLAGQAALLLERRQALITAAVTGQLEIPGVAA